MEEFVTKLAERVKQFTLGKGIEKGTTLGPLINAAAVQKVSHQVDDAVSKGATLILGCKTPNTRGFFYEPTILTGATNNMEVARDETFGPLAAVFSFRSEKDVLELANATEFGLAGYFFSQDIGRVMRVARKLECGMVGVNTGLMTACESPFRGIKESGVGIEGSKHGLSEYQNIKAVTIGNLID